MVNVLYTSFLFKIVYRDQAEHINDIQKAPQVARRLITARNSSARGAGGRFGGRTLGRAAAAAGAVVPPRRRATTHAPPAPRPARDTHHACPPTCLPTYKQQTLSCH